MQKRRFPMTHWAIVILGVLFMLAELVVVVQMVRSTGSNQGAIFILIICSAISLPFLITPVALVGLGADAIRSRIRFRAWWPPPVPPRPDVSDREDGLEAV